MTDLIQTARTAAVAAAKARADEWHAIKAKAKAETQPANPAPAPAQPAAVAEPLPIVERNGMWFLTAAWPAAIALKSGVALTTQFPALHSFEDDGDTSNSNGVLTFHTENGRASYTIRGYTATLSPGSTYTPAAA